MILLWPIESVLVSLEVVTIRELTTFEWVLLRILYEFPDMPPSLVEAAEELGLVDATFLRNTLWQLHALKAIELRVSEERSKECSLGGEGKDEYNLDLMNVQLTETGRELFRIGKIEGEPAHPSTELYFDLMTGAHIPEVPKAADKNLYERLGAMPLLEDGEWPTPTANLSLDRVRTCSLERREGHHQGESVIRWAEVDAANPKQFETLVRVTLSVDHMGRVQVGGKKVTPDRLEWLREHASTVVKAASLQDIHGKWADDDIPLADARWLSTVEELVSRTNHIKAVAELLASAERDVLVNGNWDSWLDIPMARLLADRGIHYIRQATETSLDYWKDRDQGVPGFCLSLGGGEIDDVPIAIVVDGERAIVLERISILLPNETRETVVVGVRVSGDRVHHIWSELKKGLSDRITKWTRRGHDEQGLLAALFVSASPQFAQQLADITEEQLEPLDAVAKFTLLATWFKGRPGSTCHDWVADAQKILGGYFERLNAFPREQVPRIVEAIEGLAVAEHTWDRFFKYVKMESALIDPGSLEAIGLVLDAIRSRPSFGPVPPILDRFVDSCLEIPPNANLASPELVRLVVRLAGEDRARCWASGYSALWEKPVDVVTLLAWLQAHAPVQQWMSPEFRRVATNSLQRADEATRGVLDEGLRTEIVAAWEICRLPPDAFDGLHWQATPVKDGSTATARSGISKKTNKGKKKDNKTKKNENKAKKKKGGKR